MRSKLALSFGISILFFIIAIVAANIGLSSVLGGLEDFYDTPYPMVESSLEAQTSTRKIQLNMYRAAVATDDATAQALLDEIDGVAAKMNTALDTIMSPVIRSRIYVHGSCLHWQRSVLSSPYLWLLR